MKFRNGFVSNSSSSSFVIVNKTNRTMTIVDFVLDNSELIRKFNKLYRISNCTLNDVIKSAKKRFHDNPENYTFAPNVEKVCDFGDSDGDVMGTVYDYMLREESETRNWKWNWLKDQSH